MRFTFSYRPLSETTYAPIARHDLERTEPQRLGLPPTTRSDQRPLPMIYLKAPSWWVTCLAVVVLFWSCSPLRPSAIVVGANLNNCTCPVVQTIKFGQFAPMTGPNALTGTPVRDGILAAFTEFNEDTSEDKKNVRFVLDVKDDLYVAATSVAFMKGFAADPEVFGVMGAVGTAAIEMSGPIAVANNMPLFGAYGGLGLRQPFTRQIVTIRGSFFDESAGIVEFFVSRGRSRIALFAQNDAFGASARAGVVAALDSLNLYFHSDTVYTKGNASAWDADVQIALNVMTHSSLSSLPPDGIVIAAVYDPAARFIRQFRSKWPDADIVCLTSVNIIGFLQVLAPKADEMYLLDNLFFSEFFPSPYTSNDLIVKKYIAAADHIGVPNNHYMALESYIMARFAIEVIQSIKGTVTKEAFLRVVYNESFFNVDGFQMGPYYPVAVKGGCNQGIQGNRIVKIYPNQTLSDVFTKPYTSCGYQRKIWDKITFGQSCSFTGSQAIKCADFRDGLLAAFKQVNDAGGVRGTTRLMLVTKDDLSDPRIALLNHNAMFQDPNIFGIIGSSSIAMNEIVQMLRESGSGPTSTNLNNNKVLFGAFTGDAALREPYQRNIINFRASVSDELYAMVHYCYYHRKLTRISVLYEETSYGNDRRDQLDAALKEKRWSLFTQASYSRVEQLDEAIATLFEGKGSQLQVVVFIGLDPVIAQVLTAVYRRNPSVLVLGLSETLLTSNGTTNTTSVANGTTAATDIIATMTALDNFYLTAVVPQAVQNSTSDVAQQYTMSLKKLNPLATPSIAGMEGYVVGQMMATSLTLIMGKDLTVPNLLESIYENGNFDLFGLQCGPLELVSANQSSNSKRKSCNQCMKNVYLVSGGDTVLDDYVFNFDGKCSYQAVPSVNFKEKSMRLPMAVVAGLGGLYTVLNGLVHFVMRRSPHIYAVSLQLRWLCSLGALLFFADVFVILPVPSDLTCKLQPWVLDLAFVMMMAPLAARLHTIDRTGASRKQRIKQRADGGRRMTIINVVLMLVFVGFLVVYTVVDPPKMTEAFTSDGTRYEVCMTKTGTFVYLDHVLKLLLLLWGILLCQRLTSTMLRAGETKRLRMCIYHTALLSFCYAMLDLTTATSPNLHFVSCAVIVMQNTLFLATLVLVVPTYKAIRQDPEEEHASAISGRTTSATANLSSVRASSRSTHNLNNLHQEAPHVAAKSKEYLVSRKPVQLYRGGGITSTVHATSS